MRMTVGCWDHHNSIQQSLNRIQLGPNNGHKARRTGVQNAILVYGYRLYTDENSWAEFWVVAIQRGLSEFNGRLELTQCDSRVGSGWVAIK